MKKKFLALVLTLAMVLSLVPVTALAVGENSPVTEVSTDANSPVQIKKSINAKGDTLTLEAYLTNEVTETVSTKPLDIVLVLDQSGSMAYNFEGNTTNKNTERRQYAMKEAVRNFIDKAYSENGTHKMAIVTFSEDAAQLANWTTVDANGRITLINSVKGLKDTPSGATNVAAGMQEAQTLLNAQTNSDSQKVVIVFTDGVPTTRSNFDTTVANSAITAAKAMKNAGAVVYTVGIFNGASPKQLYGDKWNYEMFEDVPCTGEVGSCWGGSWLANLFGNNDFDAIDVPAGNRFLNYLSSNFSEATEIGITKGRYYPEHTELVAGNGWKIEANSSRTAFTYYLTAINADGLNSVFEKIIEEISTLEIEAGTDAILSDTLSEYFELNIPEGSNAENAITAEQRNCTGKDANGYTWAKASTQPKMQINVTGKTVEVTGFDYTANAVTKTTTGSGTVYSGSKLVVTIPIKPDAAYTNWKKGSNLYPTNNIGDNRAGLSNYKDKNGGTLSSTLLTESPEAKVTAYTVTYNWGQNAPAGENIPTNSNTYLAGKTYPVDTTYAKGKKITDSDGGTWHFSGWTDPNNGVMGTKNVTITGSWTHTEPTQPDPTYTLTYDANGGKFGSGEAASTTKQESNITTGNHPLNYSEEYTPTHAKSGDNDVIFLGWSAEPLSVLSSASDAAANANKIINSVNVTADGATVYAVWGLDEDGNKIPDVFEATVTYKIEHGHWYNAETGGSVSKDPVTAQFTLYEKSGNQWVAKNPTLGNTIPTGQGGDQGYTADGWYKDSEKTDISKTTPVTGDVTYTFKYVKVSTEATWDVSRSKIASGLTKNSNGDWTTNVTLSLPSAEEELASDVVFVLDKSSCKEETAKKAEQMLTELQEEVKENKSNIQIGVVVFGGDAKVSYPLSVFPTTEDTLGELTKALTTKPENLMGGSNMHAGLLAAQEMLKDSGTDKNRQYVILVSDGLTRLFTGSDGKTKDIYYQYTYLDKTGEKQVGTEEGQISPKDCVYFGMIDEWTQVRTKISDNAGSRPIPYNTWESYFNKVEEWVKKDTDTYALDYETYGNDPTDKVKDKSTGEIIDPNFKYIGHNDYENHAMSVDRAVYEAYNTFTGMVDSGNHCYAVLPGSGTDFGKAFMSAMNSYAGNTDSVDFNKIGNDILYAVGAGSVVEDKMGSAFDFCGLDTLTLTLLTKDGKETQLARKIEGNTAYFGDSQDALTANTYRFKVEYKSDQDAFTWTINENVSNFTHVQLTYTVKLTKPETAAGTYGQTDLDGDTFIDGTQTQTKVDAGKALYTNQSATLVPVNSAGETGRPLFFPMPSVSYTIKGSSGGHSGGGTITIPDDVPTGLNGKDHYAYVVGYPDGLVYPQKNITRAEVATIFFRLLKDETREANMTKSNSYNDMKDGAWYTCAVSTLSKMGIIKGYEDGSFKPDASISRAEFAAIAARFDPDGDKTPATFSDVSSHWAKDEISIAANHGWIKGYEDGSFKPDQKITRAETMTLVNRVLKRLPETKDDLHKDMKTWPDNQKESAWFYLAVQEATNSHYQKLKKDGTHETWESMRETRDWAALEK